MLLKTVHVIAPFFVAVIYEMAPLTAASALAIHDRDTIMNPARPTGRDGSVAET